MIGGIIIDDGESENMFLWFNLENIQQGKEGYVWLLDIFARFRFRHQKFLRPSL